MSKGIEIFCAGLLFGMIIGLIISLFLYEPEEVKEPEPKIEIVYQDDCYVGDDYTLEIVSAKETERLLGSIK